MVRSIAWFRSQTPENINAPLVAYLHASRGMSPQEIREELEREVNHYKIASQVYAKAGNAEKKSESDRLLAITQATKEYVEEEGQEAIEAMVDKADSQLEQWCAAENGFSEVSDIPEIILPDKDFYSAED